jgi:hypothetical protein
MDRALSGEQLVAVKIAFAQRVYVQLPATKIERKKIALDRFAPPHVSFRTTTRD